MEKTPFKISKSAHKRLNEIISPEKGTFFRISILGGGCSGFQYKFGLEHTAKNDDIKISCDKATVVIDPISLTFINGSELDYKTEMVGAQFLINNPNAAVSCGCGSSFSI